ncbi:Ser-Thr-rich glycosyl-phosphatidyl-inositol-anchored membrane family-domain-containing protein [Aspergillus heterothallicus]
MIIQLAVALLLQIPSTSANEFIVPNGGYEFVAGEPTTITWEPSTPSGTVTLELLWGSIVGSTDSDELDSQVPNSGKYTWTPPDDLPDFSNYTICLIPDQPPQDFECIPQFSIAGLGNSTDDGPSTTPSPTSSDASEETGSRPNHNGDDEPSDRNESLSGAGKAGIGIGVGVGVLILIVGGLYCGRRRRRSSAAATDRQPDIPLTATAHTPAQYSSRGVMAAEAPTSGSMNELDVKWHATQVTELSGRHIREMGNTAPGYGSAELPGRSLQELDAYGRNGSREAVELPTIEHKFV